MFWARNDEKWQSQKNLVENIFWSESILNVLKRILNRKSRNRKIFPVWFILWGHCTFFGQNGKNSEKMSKSKNFRQFFLVGIDSECFNTYFKMKISKSKIFNRVKFFSWDSVVFRQKGQTSQKMTKPKMLIKNFLVGINSESFKRIKNENLEIENFFPV